MSQSELRTQRNALRAELRERFQRRRDQLLPALHYLHHEFGYLPDWAMELVGWHFGIPASQVYGSATSYSELRTESPGEHVVRVCTGLSCSMNGAGPLTAALSDKLGVRPGNTSDDGKVTFEETACAFMCAMAPVVELDGVWQGRVPVESAANIASGARSQ